MNDAIIIQHVYDKAFAPFLQITYPIHAEYCKAHNMDYQVRIGQIPNYENDAWAKISMLQEALWSHDCAIWLDADTLIRDHDADLRGACQHPINLVEWDYPLTHLQCGVMFVSGTGMPLINTMLEERKYYLKRFPTLRGWYEQGQINEMANVPQLKNYFYKLDNRWNWSAQYMPPCKPVIEGWHGEEDRNETLTKLMRRAAEDGWPVPIHEVV